MPVLLAASLVRSLTDPEDVVSVSGIRSLYPAIVGILEVVLDLTSGQLQCKELVFIRINRE